MWLLLPTVALLFLKIFFFWISPTAVPLPPALSLPTKKNGKMEIQIMPSTRKHIQNYNLKKSVSNDATCCWFTALASADVCLHIKPMPASASASALVLDWYFHRPLLWSSTPARRRTRTRAQLRTLYRPLYLSKKLPNFDVCQPTYIYIYRHVHTYICTYNHMYV